MAVTVAVSISTVPAAAVTVATMLTVALAPFAKLPRSTVTVPLLPTGGVTTNPWLAAALANTVPTGRASETTMPVAVTLPALATVMEYVRVPPGDTLEGAESVILRSADVEPPPPPETTLYVTVTAPVFPTLSLDVTMNVLVPVDDVSIGLPFATGP